MRFRQRLSISLKTEQRAWGGTMVDTVHAVSRQPQRELPAGAVAFGANSLTMKTAGRSCVCTGGYAARVQHALKFLS